LQELGLLPELTFVNHDSKLTLGSLRRIADALEIDLRFEKIFDTQIAAYVLGSYNITLGQLANEHGLQQPIEETVIRGKGRAAIPLSEVKHALISEYAGRASDLILGAREILASKLTTQGLDSVFYEIDLPHALALTRMEEFGIGLNPQPLIDLGADLGKQIEEVETLAFRNVGHDFKISSPQVLSELLFNELQLPPTKKIKTGFSTDADSLQALIGVHPVIENISLWRELSKLKSTYVDALPQHVNERTKRIHSSYSQTTAATGRLSSTHPNLQNLPIRGDRGGAIRDAFIAEKCGEDSIFLSIDYSQIELRILAHLTQDETLIASFLDNQDIHAATAAKIFSKPIDTITSVERRRAKVFNFGVLYGLSAFGLSTREGIPRNEAQEFIDSYFEAYPAIDVWRTKTIDEARDKGYAETLTGRRRAIPELSASNHNVRKAGERIAMNMPVQGTASDVIKIAMNNIDRELEVSRTDGKLARIVMQIHDELIFELPQEELNSVRAVAARLMPSMELVVPLVLDEAIGTNLGDLREIS
jgi:DNA polymerase-1